MALGYEELLFGEGRIAMVEWPELLEPLLEMDNSDEVMRLVLNHDPEPETRRITATSTGDRLEAAFERAAREMKAASTALSGTPDMSRRKP